MTVLPDFAGQHVIVFRGTSGINFGIASAFAARQALVTVASRSPENVAQAVAALKAGGAQAHGANADVRDADAVELALESSVRKFGPVDVLISGAAGNFLAPAEAISPNGFRSVLEIDLLGAFHVVRHAFAHMRRPSSILHISAPQATVPMRYQAHCAAAKAGLEQLTRVLALEWGAYSIRVNAISPGPIEDTEGFRRLIAGTAEQLRAATDSVPLRRIGTVEDIANLALFLSSPLASFVSGAVIPCDGGGSIDSVKPALEAAGMIQARARADAAQQDNAKFLTRNA